MRETKTIGCFIGLCVILLVAALCSRQAPALQGYCIVGTLMALHVGFIWHVCRK
jgi:hypothetical protein